MALLEDDEERRLRRAGIQRRWSRVPNSVVEALDTMLAVLVRSVLR